MTFAQERGVRIAVTRNGSNMTEPFLPRLDAIQVHTQPAKLGKAPLLRFREDTRHVLCVGAGWQGEVPEQAREATPCCKSHE